MGSCFISNYESVKNKTAIFLRDEGTVIKSLTYQELKDCADTIRDFIARNVASAHCCFGLLMSHNIYVPSIVASLQDVQHSFVFLTPCQKDLTSFVAELKIKWVLSFDSKLENFKIRDKLQIYNLDFLFLLENCKPEIDDYDYSKIFCVIRTSGTTGEAKFVKIENDCIKNNVESLSDKFGINSNDVIYFGTPLTFDPSLVELLLALNSGSSLMIVPQNYKINTNLLYKTLFDFENGSKSATVIQTVPSLFLRWSESQVRAILMNPNLRILAFGGENFPKSILKFPKVGSLRIFNLYGITEVSCWATMSEVTQQQTEVSIGEELGATVVEVRNESGDKITEGEGEIYIGSTLRICRIGEEKPQIPVFRATGDLAKVTSEGVFYLNRKDDVIKRFGIKVNLTKIEARILSETGLHNKCVWSRNEAKLLNFVEISEFNGSVKSKILDKLRIKLLHSLSRECLPDYIELIPKFPVTSHGKIDKRALEAHYLLEKGNESQIPDQVFKSLLRKYFGLNESQLWGSNFFEIGGNSVLAVQLLSELSENLKSELPANFTSLLFESNLECCLNCLEAFKPTAKRASSTDDDLKSVKRVKNDVALAIRWTYDLEACVDSSPVIFSNYCGGTFVAVGSFSHIFAVLEVSEGREVAKFVLPDAIESAACPSSNCNCLYVGCFDGKMYSLDPKNGKINWEYSTGDRIKSTPSICRNDTAIVFGSYDKHVHCINVLDGSLVWKRHVWESVAASPAVANTKIHIATILGTCVCLSQESGEILWKYSCGSPIFGSSCIIDDRAIFPNVRGILHCLSTNGKELWRFETKGHLFSSLLKHENLIIFGCHDRNLYVVKFTTTRPELLYTVPLKSTISSAPTLCKLNGEDVLVATTNCGVIYLIDLNRGHVMAELRLPGEVFSSPVTSDNNIYVGCRNNCLYCLTINKLDEF